MIDINCTDVNGEPITSFTQWDVNQTIYVEPPDDAEIIPDFHFCSPNHAEAMVMTGDYVHVEGDRIAVKVPNALLQEAYPITVYVYVYAADKTAAGTPAKSVAKATFEVKKRPKPSDYEYYETIDGVFLEEVDAEIRAAIAEAVEDAEDRIAADITAAEERIEEDIAATDVGNILAAENMVLSGTATKYTSWSSGYIVTNGDTIDITDVIQHESYSHMVIPCSEGEVFVVVGSSGIIPRLWAFVDEEGISLGRSEPAFEGSCVISAPKNAAYLVCVSNLTIMPDSAVNKVINPKGVAALTLRTENLEETGGYMKRYKNLAYGTARESYSITNNKNNGIEIFATSANKSTVELGRKYLVFITAYCTGQNLTQGRFQPYIKIGSTATVCTTFYSQPLAADSVDKDIEISGMIVAPQSSGSASPHIALNGGGTASKSATLTYKKVCLIDVTDADVTEVLKVLRSYTEDTDLFCVTQKEAIEANTQAIAELSTSVNGKIYCWGDSLTAGVGSEIGGGVPFPTSLGSVLRGQLTVSDRGIGGETTKTILGRQGAMPMIVQPGVTIPATSTNVAIQLVSDDGGVVAPLIQGVKGITTVSIAGIVGTLTLSNGTYYFKRNAAGTAYEITHPTALKTNGWNHKSEVLILFIGQNGGWSGNSELIAQYRKAIDFNGSNKYIVLGLTTNTRSARASLESAMYQAFGRHYINLREYLSTYAMADYGLEPTEEDVAAMENGSVPRSLLKDDGVHGNAYYYDTITRLIFERGKELGYWKDTELSEEALANRIIPSLG